MKRRRGVEWTIVACAVLFLLAGCRTARPAVRDLTGAFCDLAWRCCSPGELATLIGPFVTAEDCSDRLLNAAEISSAPALSLGVFGAGLVALPNVGALNRAVRDGRTRIDRGALNACIDYLDSLPCNMEEEPPPPPMGCVPPPPPTDPGPCDPDFLFIGRVGAGGECSSPGTSLECQEGLVCRTVSALGVEGACVAPGDVGSLCFFDSECMPELYCAGLDGTCKVPGGEGEVCAYSNPADPFPSPATLLLECDGGLSCDPLTDTCVAPCGLGATCFSDGDCDADAGLSCILGRCDFPHMQGTPCGSDDDCEGTLRCEPDPLVPGDQICVPRLPDGDPCFGDTDCLSDFCDFAAGLCAPRVPAGSACTSSAACIDGFCDMPFTPCSMDVECAATSGMCDLTVGWCFGVCVALLPEGAACAFGGDCLSGDCVAGFCRTLPLPDGTLCDFSFQCDSGFCSLGLQPVCTSLPLPDGEPCSSDFQCESLVCWALPGDPSVCIQGAAANQPCGDPMVPPCDPTSFYCDFAGAPVVCVPYLDPGEPCADSSECRGSCDLAFGYMLCDATSPPDELVCDGI